MRRHWQHKGLKMHLSKTDKKNTNRIIALICASNTVQIRANFCCVFDAGGNNLTTYFYNLIPATQILR